MQKIAGKRHPRCKGPNNTQIHREIHLQRLEKKLSFQIQKIHNSLRFHVSASTCDHVYSVLLLILFFFARRK